MNLTCYTIFYCLHKNFFKCRIYGSTCIRTKCILIQVRWLGDDFRRFVWLTAFILKINYLIIFCNLLESRGTFYELRGAKALKGPIKNRFLSRYI